MNARADETTFPFPLRWLIVPAIGGVLVASIVEAIRRRAREPTVPPLSDQWLREHVADRSGE